MKSNNKQFVTGAEAATQGAMIAGAEMMYGYPITPATEVFTIWIKKGQKYLQTEDEIAAGFGVCGAVIAGQKAFTCTAGPGHILMQDAISMAEGMRLPFVAVIGQRGGPSSGTVIYSQQEVILACFGGNGEGHRLVYSPSNLDELYNLTALAFAEAWKYKFPAIVLTDGYLLKTKGILCHSERGEESLGDGLSAVHPLINDTEIRHWRNIYNFEEELHDEVIKTENDFMAAAKTVARAEETQTDDAEVLLVAHGIVGAAAKEAVGILRERGVKAGLFRPITLRPLAKEKLDKAAAKAKKIVVVESAMGQLARLVRDQLAPEISTPFSYLQKPAVGIETEEIVKFVES